MGNYENLKQSITEVIRTNGNQEITGSILQNVLLTIISTVGANATFAGIATPATSPGTPDGSVFYIASESGTYSNFGGAELQDGLSVLMWNGSWSSQQIFSVDDEPTAGSDNLVKSGGVQKELALGAVYDVSAKNPTAGVNNDGKFESLSALLEDTNLDTLIPISVRKGGMSIKFVQSSDNKYVRYNYFLADATTNSKFTNVNNWQGVDDKPTAGSPNLVKSGGVYKQLNKKAELNNDDSDSDLDVGDEKGNVVLEIKGGHLKTKNFESNKISPQNSNSDADLDIGDEEGNVVLEIKGGHLKTKNFDSRQSGNEVGIPDTIEGTTPLIIGEPIPTNYKRVKFLTQKETDVKYQAMDFYGDYMVSLVESKAAGSYNYKVPFGYLYDVRSETKICDLVFPYPSSYATCHNNAAMFGAEFYNSNSEFPIFWINQWQTQKAFFGYDLQKQGNVYVPVLVQIIEPDSTLANSTTFGKAYGDFAIDKDNSKLYHLGYKNNFGDVICVSEYNMPTISDGVEQTIDGITCKVVTLTTNDVTDSYDTIPMTGFQDKCYSNGQIFVTYGYGNQIPYLAIAVINLMAKKVTHIINLSSDRTDMSHIIGTSAYRETEALAVYAGNRLMVGYYKEQEIYEVKL